MRKLLCYSQDAVPEVTAGRYIPQKTMNNYGFFLNTQNDVVVHEDCRVCTRELSQRKIVAKSMLIFH